MMSHIWTSRTNNTSERTPSARESQHQGGCEINAAWLQVQLGGVKCSGTAYKVQHHKDVAAPVMYSGISPRSLYTAGPSCPSLCRNKYKCDLFKLELLNNFFSQWKSKNSSWSAFIKPFLLICTFTVMNSTHRK